MKNVKLLSKKIAFLTLALCLQAVLFQAVWTNAAEVHTVH